MVRMLLISNILSAPKSQGPGRNTQTRSLKTLEVSGQVLALSGAGILLPAKTNVVQAPKQASGGQSGSKLPHSKSGRRRRRGTASLAVSLRLPGLEIGGIGVIGGLDSGSALVCACLRLKKIAGFRPRSLRLKRVADRRLVFLALSASPTPLVIARSFATKQSRWGSGQAWRLARTPSRDLGQSHSMTSFFCSTPSGNRTLTT
jgi:hypothetical protein